jgi:hypothetical protein
LTLRIGGTEYRLRPMPPQPGFHTVWTLYKLDPERSAAYTVAHAKGEDARCTCPDHELSGSICKHVMSLAALGLIRKPKAARPKKAPSSARVKRIHAKNARATIAEANGLDPSARRHLAEISVPAKASRPLPGTARRAAITGLPRAEEMDIRLELSPTAFAHGFRRAIAERVRAIRGELEPEDQSGPVPVCIVCGLPFHPERSRARLHRVRPAVPP